MVTGITPEREAPGRCAIPALVQTVTSGGSPHVHQLVQTGGTRLELTGGRWWAEGIDELFRDDLRREGMDLADIAVAARTRFHDIVAAQWDYQYMQTNRSL